MRSGCFRHRPACNVPKSWQGLMFYMGKCYPDLPKMYVEMVNRLLKEYGNGYDTELLYCFTTGRSLSSAEKPYHVSYGALRKPYQRFLEALYRELLSLKGK